MRFFRNSKNSSTPQEYIYYASLLFLGFLLVAGLHLLGLYQQRDFEKYYRSRTEKLQIETTAALRSWELAKKDLSQLSPEKRLELLAERIAFLFDTHTLGIFVLPEEDSEKNKPQVKESSFFCGNPLFFVPNCFWKEYLRFLEPFPQLYLPESLQKELFHALKRGRDFCISWETPKGWYDVLGLRTSLESREKAFLLTFEKGTEFYQTKRLYFFLSLFVTLLVILLIGIFVMTHGFLKKIRRMAILDKLTKAYNRGAFIDIALKEQHRGLRKNHPMSLVMVDLDNFKQVNDRHGHNMGDSVLCRISRIIKSNIRDYDVFGRWGGDEFLLLLPETRGFEARKIGEKLLGYIRNDKTLEALKVTASIGIYEVEDLKEPLSEIIEKVDQIMYTAKKQGRNQVVYVPYYAMEEMEKKKTTSQR